MIRSLAAILAFSATAAYGACQDDLVELRGDFGSARFTVTVADDDSERAQGLMNVPEMPASQGMLFIYEEPRRATFWMKNTLIPLDMIFVAPDGKVARIHENAVPLDETIIDGGPGILVVLEINGGMSAQLGLRAGAQMRHPAFDPAIAAWPCE